MDPTEHIMTQTPTGLESAGWSSSSPSGSPMLSSPKAQGCVLILLVVGTYPLFPGYPKAGK